MDFLQTVKFAKMLAPISGNATAYTTTAVDCIGWGRATILVMLGVIGADMDSLKVQESNDDSSYADVTGATFTAPTTAASAGLMRACSIPLRGSHRRYLKLVADPGASATLCAAVCILSEGVNSPTSATEAGLEEWLRAAG